MRELTWPDDLERCGFRPTYCVGNEVIEHYSMPLQAKRTIPMPPQIDNQPAGGSPQGARTMPAQKHQPTDILLGVGGPKPVGIRKQTPTQSMHVSSSMKDLPHQEEIEYDPFYANQQRYL